MRTAPILYKTSLESRQWPAHSRSAPFPLRMSAVLESEKSAVSAPPVNNIKYLTPEEANEIYADLTSDDVGFSPLTLMELSGRSIADVIYDAYPPERVGRDKILVLCGKGESGGQGLVAARHLHYFGYEVEVRGGSASSHA